MGKYLVWLLKTRSVPVSVVSKKGEKNKKNEFEPP